MLLGGIYTRPGQYYCVFQNPLTLPGERKHFHMISHATLCSQVTLPEEQWGPQAVSCNVMVCDDGHTVLTVFHSTEFGNIMVSLSLKTKI